MLYNHWLMQIHEMPRSFKKGKERPPPPFFYVLAVMEHLFPFLLSKTSVAPSLMRMIYGTDH